MSTAEYPDALTRRIEQLAAASGDEGEGEGAAVAALVGALRSEIGAVRAELGSLRAETGAVRTREAETAAAAQSALEDTRGVLESRMAVLEDALDGLSERIEALARDGASTTTALLGTLTTTVRDLDKRIADEGRDSGERLVGRLSDATGTRVSALESTLLDKVSEVLRVHDEELRRDVLGALETARREAAADRAAVAELTETVRGALDGFGAALAGSLSGLGASITGALADSRDETRAALDEGVERLSGAVVALRTELVARDDQAARRLDALVATVGQAKDSTRQAGERLLALADAVRTQREEVGGLLEGVGEELLARTSEELADLAERIAGLDATVGGVAADVRQRLAALDGTLGLSTATTERWAERLGAVAEAQDGLTEAVESFRAEWPTRTFEVVRGAKAVAETVVREVRTEVEAQLARVREELSRTTDEVEGARDGLDAGTDRLARAGKVLVGYLEQRDRLLEAERDRVLHDVLDSFASGLSSRERAALAGRVGDVVHRRRDARDAERYRAAVGRPTPPVVDVPDEVTRLVPDDATAAAAAREARLRRAEAARPPVPPSTARGSLATSAGPAKRPARTVRALPGGRPPVPAVAKAATAKAAPTRRAGAAKAAPASKAAPARTAAPVEATPASTTGRAKRAPSTEKSAAKQAPAKQAPAKKAPAKKAPTKNGSSRTAPPRTGAAAKASGSSGRLEQMPEVPDVRLALDAAAPPLEPAPAAHAPAVPAPLEPAPAVPAPDERAPAGANEPDEPRAMVDPPVDPAHPRS